MEVSLSQQHIRRRRTQRKGWSLPRIPAVERFRNWRGLLHLVPVRGRRNSGGAGSVLGKGGQPPSAGVTGFSFRHSGTSTAAGGLFSGVGPVPAARRRRARTWGWLRLLRNSLAPGAGGPRMPRLTRENQQRASLLFFRLGGHVSSPVNMPLWLGSVLFLIMISLGSPYGVIAGVDFSGGAPRELALPEQGLFENLMEAEPLASAQGVQSSSAREGRGGREESEELTVPENAVEAVAAEDYTVQKGEVLSRIAERFGLSVGTLISYNGIENVRRVMAGTELKIPSRDGVLYQVERGDNLSYISQKYNVSLSRILDANNLQTATSHPGSRLFLPGAAMDPYQLKKALGELFIYPTRGRLTSYYGMRLDPFTGMRQFHNGIDIANQAGTPVRAAMDGYVREVGVHSVYGNYVILGHDNQYQTLYAHLRRIRVAKGRRISQGQALGNMGNTGYSTGSHLHFSIFKGGKHANPLEYLR